MSAPTQPTETSIVTEAFNQFGNSNPSAADITRAKTYGLAKVKWDIWAIGKRWKMLRTSQYLALKVGVSRYANPTDFEQDIQDPGMTILDGTSRGTCQAVAAGTMTLAAAEAATQSGAEGHLLALLSGTGANQAEQIDDYNTTTKVATMRASWGTTPSGTVTYMIVNSHDQVAKKVWSRRNLITRPSDMGRPSEAYEMAEGAVGFIELYPTPDKIYMLKRDYYANLLLVDTAVTLYDTVLRNWAGVLTQGVLAWLMTGLDDTRARDERTSYATMLKLLQANELDNQNESAMQVRVSD